MFELMIFRLRFPLAREHSLLLFSLFYTSHMVDCNKHSETYSYNQKIVLRETVLDFISSHNIQSLLDIGAGWTETALFYKNAVKNYLAVEQDKERAELLEEEGLIVMNESFPCSIEGKFDLVLSSHSISEQVQAYEAFLQTAWKITNKQGYLMLITFKGADDTLVDLSNELIPDRAFQKEDERFEEMMRILRSFGDPVISKVTSYRKSKDPEDIAKSISCSFRLDYCRWKERLLSVLESRFKDEHGYFFPHEHLVVVLKR